MKLRSTADNKVLPKAGRNGFVWTFVQGSTLGFLMKFSAKNPRLRQYPERYVIWHQKSRSEINFTILSE